MRERYGMTELRKRANRIPFGPIKESDEYTFSNRLGLDKDLGMIGKSGSGAIRLRVNDGKGFKSIPKFFFVFVFVIFFSLFLVPCQCFSILLLNFKIMALFCFCLGIFSLSQETKRKRWSNNTWHGDFDLCFYSTSRIRIEQCRSQQSASKC
jgi:hypothetical protein